MIRRVAIFSIFVTSLFAADPAEAVRQVAVGWTRAAEIPQYAGLPDGKLRPTVIFYRHLPGTEQRTQR